METHLARSSRTKWSGTGKLIKLFIEAFLEIASYVDDAVRHRGLAGCLAARVVRLEAARHALVFPVFVHLVAQQRNFLLTKHPHQPQLRKILIYSIKICRVKKIKILK